MAEVSFIVGDNLDANGDPNVESIGTTPLQVRVTLTEVDDDTKGGTGQDIEVKLEVLTPNADLRGFHFNIADNSLLASLGITGADITNILRDANGVPTAPNLTNAQLGDLNLNPAGPFEIVLELGTPGASPDFINTTTFYLSNGSNDLSIDTLLLNEAMGIRATTVGDEEPFGSSKLVGIFQDDPDDVVFEGLSHGYWKNHVSDWDLPSNETSSFETFFGGIDVPWLKVGKTGPADDYSFAQVLSLQGGGVNALARELVAAVLNASDEDINYAYTVDQIKVMVAGLDFNDSVAVENLKNLLEANNTIGNIV